MVPKFNEKKQRSMHFVVCSALRQKDEDKSDGCVAAPVS
jgi:hypothetical protein